MIATIGYWICSPFAALLRLFYHLTVSYGVSLILFTLVIKLILLPLQMKSKKSMVRMSRMSGRMQEIQKKYANNQAKLGEEMQKLYAEEGVNPMSGCVWSFLPMPILIALYYIIREPIVYFMNFGSRAAGLQVVEAARSAIEGAGITLTSSKAYEQIEMIKVIGGKLPDFAGKYPNWIHVDYNFLGLDLSARPSDYFSALGTGLSWAVIGLMLIPVISAVLSFFLSKVTSAGQPQAAGAAGSTTKMMMYMMPLMSLYIGFILPAALGIYWIAQSAFSIVQEALLGKFYNGRLEEEETARAEARQAERQKKMEEARLHQEEQRRLSAKQQAAAKKKRAADAAKSAGKNAGKKNSTNENGRVGDRPYARGRAFSEKRYPEDNENQK